MGTTLSNTQIRNTYIGLLKTSDNTAVAGSLKTISDGAGNDTGLKVSSTEVNVNSLSIQSVPNGPALTKMLMWNDSTKDVEYRNYNPTGATAFNTATITGGNGGATAQIDSSTAILTINAGTNIDITGSGSSITINTSVGDAAEQVNFAMTENSVSAGAGDFYSEIVHTFTDYAGTNTVSRIRGTNGVDISSTANADGGRDFIIDAGKKTWIIDYPSQGGTSSDGSTGSTAAALLSTMDLTDEESADLLILVDVSAINSNASLNTQEENTITLPPPYKGRRIKVVMQPVPSSSTTPQNMALPIRFKIATSSTKDTNVRNSRFCGRTVLKTTDGNLNNGNNRAGYYRVQSVGAGSGSATSYVEFQDCTNPNPANDNFYASSTTLGLGIGTQFDITGIGDDRYVVDIVAYAAFGLEITNNNILTN